jgi:hypothetical protein
MNIHVPTLIKSLKAAFVSGVKDYKKLHDYALANFVAGLATSDIINSNPEFKHLNLARTNLIFMLFPKIIFKSIRSPQYIPYSHVAKILNQSHSEFKMKNLILAIFGLSNVKYYNEDLVKTVFPFIESKVDVNILKIMLTSNRVSRQLKKFR